MNRIIWFFVAMLAALPVHAQNKLNVVTTTEDLASIGREIGGDRITIRARSDARFMMLGGEPMDGPRFIWWNFVASRKDRIEQAKADWRAARFDSVPGDSEFIPLPEPAPKVVDYP